MPHSRLSFCAAWQQSPGYTFLHSLKLPPHRDMNHPSPIVQAPVTLEPNVTTSNRFMANAKMPDHNYQFAIIEIYKRVCMGHKSN